MKVKRDQVTGLILVALGLFFAYLVSRFETPFTAAYPGPSLMPMIGVVLLVVCGIGIFVSGTRQEKAPAKFIGLDGWVRIIATFLILCAYILGMKFLGFLVMTPFVLYGITTYFAKASKVETKLWVRIVFAVAVTAVVYLMYVELFGMTLPVGELFE